MKIREHPKIKWQEWLQPSAKTGSGFRYPPSDVGERILNGAQYHHKDRDKPNYLSSRVGATTTPTTQAKEALTYEHQTNAYVRRTPHQKRVATDDL